MPPGPRRMLTPETALAIGKSALVNWRAQPPLWMRVCALFKEAQNCDNSPTPVAGGLTASENCNGSAGLRGHGSVRAPGLLLTAPSGGSSGFPNAAACAEPAASSAPPAAATASMSRRDRKLVAPLSGRSGTALSAGNLLIGMISSTVALMATNVSQFHSRSAAEGACGDWRGL